MGLGIKALNYSASEAFADAEEAEVEQVKVALTPAIIEGEGDFAGLTGAVPGLIPVPTQKRSKDELRKGATASAVGSIIFALIFNVLLFVAAPLLLTNALFIAAGWAVPAASDIDRRNNNRPWHRVFADCRSGEQPGVVLKRVVKGANLFASGSAVGSVQSHRRSDSHDVLFDHDFQLFAAEGYSPRVPVSRSRT